MKSKKKKQVSKPKEKVAHEAGKRKRAVARATIRKGTGKITINRRNLEIVEPDLIKQRLLEPIRIAGDLAEGLDIRINVSGGGWSSQIESARLAVAKALVKYTGSAQLRKKYLDYDRHLLVADTRYKETRKPGTHSNARARRQQSFR